MNSKNFYCIIMAGGTGRRFWPYSRKALPKQFLDFFGTGQTLLQQTYERYKQILPAENIFITTNQHYRELVLNSLPGFSESNLIVEEEHRNTAPAIAYASYVIQKINPDGSIVVAPSDHLILKMDEFKQDILKSLEFASHSDKLLTLGIKPSYPETGYGYIQVSEEKEEDFYKVKTFIEKPLREFAEVFVQSNEFYRNSGIFCLLQHGIPPRFRNGSQNYIIDLLLNKRTDCHNLVFLLLLPIFNIQMVSFILCKSFFHRNCI